LERIKTYDQLRDIKDYKLTTGISDSGKLEMYLMINVATELKTFMVKPDEKLLMLSKGFDYSTLNSFDITKKIKQSIRNPLPIKQLLF